MATLANYLVSSGVVNQKPRSGPLWAGPSALGAHGGVTFSMLNRFLSCRERFRMYAVEGLRTAESFNHRIEYGNLWHCCEESYATSPNKKVGFEDAWVVTLQQYCRDLLKKYPLQQSDIEHWYMVCFKQFPEYVKYWKDHPDVQSRTPLLSEQAFCIPYTLPSRRVVRLRGKVDSVDIVGKGRNSGMWIQENKTKGNPNEFQIRQQLRRDLQSMLYAVVLVECQQKQHTLKSGDTSTVIPEAIPFAGIRYNVVRRPLSGGKGTIVQKQPTQGTKCPKCKGEGIVAEKKGVDSWNQCPKCGGKGRINPQPGETKEEYYERLADYIMEEPETYFMRWEIPVLLDDILKFRHQVLDPMLEQLCDWWEWISTNPSDPFRSRVHTLTPYGIYSTMSEDRTGDYDQYIDNKSEAGLTRVDTLFRELQ